VSVLSTIWLAALLFTPAAYWLSPERLRSAILTAVTLSLLLLISPATCLFLLLAVLVAWVCRTRFASSGIAVAIASALQLAPLIAWRISAEWPLPFVAQFIIPLGLAYIALRGVHYVVEAYRGALPDHRLSDVVDYFFFLPTIIAGPIHRFPQFLTDARRRRWNSELFSEGLERILYGYVKITFIANLLVNTLATRTIAEITTDGSQLDLYLTMFVRGLNGYFQFSGYSDVAIGFARLLGFRVIENFNSPLTKPNVQQFWSAWHISLTSWCRDYVYTPTFSLTRARTLGILTSMAVLGLWHEFTPRYLAWGLYNGAGIVLWHRWRRLFGERIDEALSGRLWAVRLWNIVAVILTMHFIFAGFVLVQHDSLYDALAYLGAMVGVGG
jgi:alginate O-acetyltransferase complex protein AlgI